MDQRTRLLTFQDLIENEVKTNTQYNFDTETLREDNDLNETINTYFQNELDQNIEELNISGDIEIDQELSQSFMQNWIDQSENTLKYIDGLKLYIPETSEYNQQYVTEFLLKQQWSEDDNLFQSLLLYIVKLPWFHKVIGSFKTHFLTNLSGLLLNTNTMFTISIELCKTTKQHVAIQNKYITHLLKYFEERKKLLKSLLKVSEKDVFTETIQQIDSEYKQLLYIFCQYIYKCNQLQPDTKMKNMINEYCPQQEFHDIHTWYQKLFFDIKNKFKSMMTFESIKSSLMMMGKLIAKHMFELNIILIIYGMKQYIDNDCSILMIVLTCVCYVGMTKNMINQIIMLPVKMIKHVYELINQMLSVFGNIDVDMIESVHKESKRYFQEFQLTLIYEEIKMLQYIYTDSIARQEYYELLYQDKYKEQQDWLNPKYEQAIEQTKYLSKIEKTIYFMKKSENTIIQLMVMLLMKTKTMSKFFQCVCNSFNIASIFGKSYTIFLMKMVGIIPEQYIKYKNKISKTAYTLIYFIVSTYIGILQNMVCKMFEQILQDKQITIIQVGINIVSILLGTVTGDVITYQKLIQDIFPQTIIQDEWNKGLFNPGHRLLWKQIQKPISTIYESTIIPFYEPIQYILSFIKSCPESFDIEQAVNDQSITNLVEINEILTPQIIQSKTYLEMTDIMKEQSHFFNINNMFKSIFVTEMNFRINQLPQKISESILKNTTFIGYIKGLIIAEGNYSYWLPEMMLQIFALFSNLSSGYQLLKDRNDTFQRTLNQVIEKCQEQETEN